MSHHDGDPIVRLPRALDLSLQDSLLSAIEQVLTDAGADRVWVQVDPAGELQVYAALPRAVEPAQDAVVTRLPTRLAVEAVDESDELVD